MCACAASRVRLSAIRTTEATATAAEVTAALKVAAAAVEAEAATAALKVTATAATALTAAAATAAPALTELIQLSSVYLQLRRAAAQRTAHSSADCRQAVVAGEVAPKSAVGWEPIVIVGSHDTLTLGSGVPDSHGRRGYIYRGGYMIWGVEFGQGGAQAPHGV